MGRRWNRRAQPDLQDAATPTRNAVESPSRRRDQPPEPLPPDTPAGPSQQPRDPPRQLTDPNPRRADDPLPTRDTQRERVGDRGQPFPPLRRSPRVGAALDRVEHPQRQFLPRGEQRVE